MKMTKTNTTETVTDIDYADSAVDNQSKKGFLTMFMIMLGFTFFSASMWAGQQMAAGLDFYGFVGSLLGIFGDLCFSIVKRQTGIKDYGNLIPGHGGVLDRFDSLTLVAPAMEVLLVLLPMAV